MIGPTIDSVAKFRVMNVPLGKAALYMAGLGLGEAIAAVGEGVLGGRGGGIPIGALAAGGAASWASKNVGIVSRFFGDTGAEVLAVSTAAAPINRAVDVHGNVYRLVSAVNEALGRPALPALPTSSPTRLLTPGGEEGPSQVETKAAATRQGSTKASNIAQKVASIQAR